MWSSIEQLVNEVSEQIKAAKAAIQTDEFNMEQLKKAGISYAGTWWKARKYLYLVHPSDGFGYRKREYIGADAEKVQAALAGIERGKLFEQCKQRRDWNRKVLSEMQLQLTYTHRNGKQMVTATVLQDVPGCTNLDDQMQLALN